MATIARASNSISISPVAGDRVRPESIPAMRPRRVSREAGRAIEMLGHAIDYLADELALDCMSANQRGLKTANPRIAAIELLMACNREVYFSCPELPSLSQRIGKKLQSLLRIHPA